MTLNLKGIGALQPLDDGVQLAGERLIDANRLRGAQDRHQRRAQRQLRSGWRSEVHPRLPGGRRNRTRYAALYTNDEGLRDLLATPCLPTPRAGLEPATTRLTV